MSLPEYPRNEDGTRDHMSAIKMMFGTEAAPSLASPSYAESDGLVMSFSGYADGGKLLYWRIANDEQDNTLREVKTVNIWDDWVNGPLMPVRVEYLAADEAVYNTEEQKVVR